MPEHDAKLLGMLRRRIEDGIDGDAQFVLDALDPGFRGIDFGAQLGRAGLDQLDKNFVLGFEVKVESAEAHVGLARDIGDAGLMVSLARDDALGRLEQIDAGLLASAIEAIGDLMNVACRSCHQE